MVPATCYSQQKLISGCTGCYGWRAAVASIFSTCFCCHQMLCRFVLTKCLMFAQKVCSNSKGQGGVNMISLPEHFAWQPQAQQALVNGIARCLPTGPNSRRVKLFKYPSVCGSLKFAEVNPISIGPIGTHLVIRSDRFLSNPCLSHPIALSTHQLNGGTTSCSEKRRFPGLSLSWRSPGEQEWICLRIFGTPKCEGFLSHFQVKQAFWSIPCLG